MVDMLQCLFPQASGMVMEGQRIIDRGDIVDAKTYRVLEFSNQAMEKLTQPRLKSPQHSLDSYHMYSSW